MMFSCGPLSATTRDGVSLFSGITVSLGESQFVGLEGPSGSGKTTLLRSIAGLQTCRGVERRLAGRRFTGREMPAWRSRVTLLAQDAPMLPGTLLENLRFPFLSEVGGDRHFDEHRCHELLARSGLGDLKTDRDARSLSGGERHRLAVVRGLLWDPAVLLCDEPMSGLDQDAAETIFDMLRNQAARTGRAVVCTLHDRERSSLADLRLHLAGGELSIIDGGLQ